jgi:type I restriction enzyme M protein
MKKNELTNIVSKCCDILRTDDGINGATHYTEVLSWVLYLKFLQDKETKTKESILQKKFKWSVWTKEYDDEELIDFVNNELFPYLSKLKSRKTSDFKSILGVIFQNTTNHVHSGHLLSLVIKEVEKLHFNTSKDMFTLSYIYEDLLKSMGEGGGNSGEFYTPRALVRTLVHLLDPKAGESVYDPACGTGGFLVEAYEYMKSSAKTKKKLEKLEIDTFFGQEKTPLPFVLGLMNLTLHGIEHPNITKGNTLSTPYDELDGEYDVVLANPPFGGKEQKNVQDNFPIQGSATELLFMQHMEKVLKSKKGRAAVVIPEGILFQSGTAYKSFKEKLIMECNVHSIVSLPAGIFLPYSAVKTSVIFFDKTKRTTDVWFYEVPLINGKKLTKKSGISDKHFQELLELFPSRVTGENSWRIDADKIINNDFNLSASTYNPNSSKSEELADPEEYAEQIKNLLGKSLNNIDSLFTELRQ